MRVCVWGDQISLLPPLLGGPDILPIGVFSVSIHIVYIPILNCRQVIFESSLHKNSRQKKSFFTNGDDVTGIFLRQEGADNLHPSLSLT